MADFKALERANKLAKDQNKIARDEWKLQCDKEDRAAQQGLRQGQSCKESLVAEGESRKAELEREGQTTKDRLIAEGKATRDAFVADGTTKRAQAIQEGKVEKARLIQEAVAKNADEAQSLADRAMQISQSEEELVSAKTQAEALAEVIIANAHREAKRIKVDRVMDIVDADNSPYTLDDYARKPVEVDDDEVPCRKPALRRATGGAPMAIKAKAMAQVVVPAKVSTMPPVQPRVAAKAPMCPLPVKIEDPPRLVASVPPPPPPPKRTPMTPTSIPKLTEGEVTTMLTEALHQAGVGRDLFR